MIQPPGPKSSGLPHAAAHAEEPRCTAWWWYLVCALMVVGMGVLRLAIYPNSIVPLTYALPLLVVLWHRDAKLHWAMAAAFVAMVVVKLVFFLPPAALKEVNEWVFAGMQLANIILPAGVLHATVRLMDRLETAMGALERTNGELEASNEELAAREEEITQQNEELQSQAEELEQQTEELNAQTEELQGINEELAARERTLGDLLETSVTGAGESETLATMGATVRRLVGSRATGVAILEPHGAEMHVRPLAGLASGESSKMRRDRSFGELVLARDRAGAIADTALRPDLQSPALEGGRAARSVAAAPIRVGDGVAAVLEVYSDASAEWSEHDLRLVQWLADQCGRMWVTSRLREELAAQQRLMRSVTDSSSVALFMTDGAGVCTYMNPAAERLTGYTLSELRAAPLEELLHAEGAAGAATGVSETAEAGSSTPGMLRRDTITRKGGSALEVLVSWCPVALGPEAPGQLLEIVDATEHRKYEREREELLQSERAARSEAERANHAKDEFVATLSHELRTPLNAVLGWAALLRKNAGNPDEMAKGIEVIERNARHQSQLISDLLDISRITAGKIRLDVQAVDVPLVVEGALEAVRPAAEARGVRLDRVIETMDRVVMGDPGRLQQVVWNLLSNAIKFTPRDGRVQVVVSRIASYVQINVSDTGEGISPDLLPHLFERYRQADGSSSRRHGGLGLGLAIAKHLVELHGGSIHARSDGQGKGASFAILLPVRAAEPHGAAQGPHPLTQTAIRLDASAPTLQGFCVLVVDDEEDARDLVGRILRDRGAEVRTASSAQEALALLEQEHPNMLVSDIGMPGMDGYTLIRTVRERWPASAREMPAVALTAFARSEDRTRALLAGFQSHIAKPVEAAELVATVASLRFAIPGFGQSHVQSQS